MPLYGYSITLFNLDLAINFIDPRIVHATYQLERCPTTDRLHYQAYVETKLTFKELRSELFPKTHVLTCWTPLHPARCLAYCQKPDTRVTPYQTHGSAPMLTGALDAIGQE